MLSWLIPMVVSLIGTAVGAGTSIATNNKQLSFQKQQLAEQQRLEQENVNNQRLMNQQEQQINNQQTVNEFTQKMNKGYSTGTTGNQMGTGLGVGVQGLNNTGYLNEDSLMAKVGGLFGKKDNTKRTVRDNNNLYFDRIEYAKCGGRFRRK